ncbi:hypothetical protein ABH920_005195 [Catenulispora sp. EB89]|uniref:iron-containing redox enzyme family protein n=1 Tax=Catenulispora sp. EB89 TaxID=3156257 RepID=UPI00351622A8
MTATLSRSDMLHVKISLADHALNAALDRLWRPDGLVLRYGRYLAAMHQVIRASVPLMDLAARRCAERGAADPLAARLHDYLVEHIDEERGHDLWLLDDLAVMHGSNGVPEPSAGLAAARLVGPQYYWIEHGHPATLLGYIAVLESRAPAVWLADRLALDTGLPTEAFRTVRAHAELDGGHTSQLDELLDDLPLSRAQDAAIGVSALHTIGALTELIRELSPDATDSPSSDLRTTDLWRTR